jgi:uncharacterized protein YndB with AHSA1/START domain
MSPPPTWTRRSTGSGPSPADAHPLRGYAAACRRGESFGGFRLITLAMATVVAAPRRSVWAALTEPEQMIHWRPGVTGLLGATPREPTPGRVLRLRCILQDVPITLEERALEVAPEERLRSELRFGLFHGEETFTLATADPDGGHTRVSLRIATPSETPLVGESLDRFAVRRFATELAGNSLAALRDWCELGRAAGAQAPLDVQILGDEAPRVVEALPRER